MVSFQCEGCGDVQTKKKLDSHRNHCRAPFTCIDCMTTFHGVDYRGHTTCMTEDQKYQGHYYREKPLKASKRKSVSILEPTDQNALIRQPRVEEVPEIEVPPQAPTPPPAVPSKSDSVFDYLIEEEDLNTPRIVFTEDKRDEEAIAREEMSMKNGAPSVFSRPTSRNEHQEEEERFHDDNYEENGFSYGTEPVRPRSLDVNASTVTLEYMTPSAQVAKAQLSRKFPESATHSRNNSNSEKKRKRAQTDDRSVDTGMMEPPETVQRTIADTPSIAHSGLTGGLQRMVTNGAEDFPFAISPESEPDRSRSKEKTTTARRASKRVEPVSPLKRTKRSKEEENGLGITIKGRAGKVMSMIGGALSTNNVEGAVVKTRRRASSSDNNAASESRTREGEKRERKKHKVHRHNGTSRDNVKMEHSRPRRQDGSSSPETSKRKVKAIEYQKQDQSNSDSDDEQHRDKSQMVVFGAEEQLRRKCEAFLAYTTKGPHSERGYSMNKTLKRWHRDSDIRSSSAKQEEEKELWKGLRLKKNDRGEIVLFF